MEALRTITPISLSNILVTTDFSQVSRTALPYATALARQYEAKIVVAHALSRNRTSVCRWIHCH